MNIEKMDLKKKYEISKGDVYLCSMIRRLKGRKCPEFLYSYSLKKYGFKDNLARYYTEKYSNIPVGKYSWGYKYTALYNFYAVSVVTEASLHKA